MSIARHPPYPHIRNAIGHRGAPTPSEKVLGSIEECNAMDSDEARPYGTPGYAVTVTRVSRRTTVPYSDIVTRTKSAAELRYTVTQCPGRPAAGPGGGTQRPESHRDRDSAGLNAGTTTPRLSLKGLRASVPPGWGPRRRTRLQSRVPGRLAAAALPGLSGAGTLSDGDRDSAGRAAAARAPRRRVAPGAGAAPIRPRMIGSDDPITAGVRPARAGARGGARGARGRRDDDSMMITGPRPARSPQQAGGSALPPDRDRTRYRLVPGVPSPVPSGPADSLG
eukprot:768665-Hanusia_phi.AAC.2